MKRSSQSALYASALEAAGIDAAIYPWAVAGVAALVIANGPRAVRQLSKKYLAAGAESYGF